MTFLQAITPYIQSLKEQSSPLSDEHRKSLDDRFQLLTGNSKFTQLPLTLKFHILSFAFDHRKKQEFTARFLENCVRLHQPVLHYSLQRLLTQFVPELDTIVTHSPTKLLQGWNILSRLSIDKGNMQLFFDQHFPKTEPKVTYSLCSIQIEKPYSSITAITFRNVHLDKHPVKTLIKRCPNLQLFDIRECTYYAKLKRKKLVKWTANKNLSIQMD